VNLPFIPGKNEWFGILYTTDRFSFSTQKMGGKTPEKGQPGQQGSGGGGPFPDPGEKKGG
jgi:hypothetical protein